MHLAVHACFYLAILLLFLSDSAHSTQVAVNGIAIHSEFGKEQFIGALYSDTPSNTATTLVKTPNLRMELKIIADEGMTVRRFSRMWIEGISINNTPEVLSAQASNMVLFDNMFKGRLASGDHLILAFEKGKGTSVTLNTIPLGAIADDGFFGMLLRAWIGAVPLSTDYKSLLLQAGNINPDIQQRFDSIRPQPQRVKDVSEWLKTNIDAASSKRSSAAKSSSSSKSIAFRSGVSSSSDSSISARKVANSSFAFSSIAAEDKPSLTSETLLVRQFYISTLLKKIRGNTRYPARANELGQGASLRLSVEVDRTGKILHTQFVQGSQHALLNQAALDAIKASEPLPPMPEALTGTSFEFTVPINFVPVK